ncbi:hypothetical protein F2Q70_00022507 [Brassica cretica]|uniref:Replication factor A C-terminal domain-containing protein n=1 Tax=Brassica cretica TaxID=69181 RepID=A0A8S9GM65_BRACR|nr:hypothetical protein F2Q70_00022507 [Brassica cretica]
MCMSPGHGVSASAAAAASMKTVVVRFADADAAADAAAYYITTAGFISVSRRTRRQTQLPAYRLEMAIADSTAEGTFVCFDGVMTKLHNLRASEAGQMLAEEGENPEDIRMPPFINDMEGKTLTFQVRVSAFNFTAHHQMFTITRILKEHERVPSPDFVGGNDEDDDNMGDGGRVPVCGETGEGSSDAEKSADGNPADAAAKKSAHSSTKAVKKARVV